MTVPVYVEVVVVTFESPLPAVFEVEVTEVTGNVTEKEGEGEIAVNGPAPFANTVEDAAPGTVTVHVIAVASPL